MEGFSEEVSCIDIWMLRRNKQETIRKIWGTLGIPGGGKRAQCKGPEAGMSWGGSRRIEWKGMGSGALKGMARVGGIDQGQVTGSDLGLKRSFQVL